ncbi:MAG TPA: S8 family serine peptidase [Actinomycetota bacterium]
MTARGPVLPKRIMAALALVGGMVAAAPSAPAALKNDVSLAFRSSIDPALPVLLAAGPAPVMFAWDKEDITREEVRSALEAQGTSAHLLDRVSVGVTCVGSMSDVAALSLTDGVRSVWGNHQMTTATSQSVPTAFNGSPSSVWNGMGWTGKGVGLAVLDTGLDATHPDLAMGTRTKLNVRVIVSHREIMGPYNDPCIQNTYTDDVNKAIYEFSGIETESLEDTETASGHGTHIAGVAAGDGTASDGRYKGMAPEASLIGVGVTDSFHRTQQIDDPTTGYEAVRPSTLGAVAGISYVLDKTLEKHRTHVILAGWGMSRELYDPWHPLSVAIRDAADFAITVVIPAGNDGPQASDCSAAETCYINQYAASPFAISVAATPKTSRTTVADVSSRGDSTLRPARDEFVRYEPTIAAPGVSVISVRRIGISPYAQVPGTLIQGEGNPSSVKSERFDADYRSMTGTSVAAAHVAGTVALMQQAAVDTNGCFLTFTQVRDILTQTATSMPGYGPDRVGAGMVDATQAVALAQVYPPEHSTANYRCPLPEEG